MSTRVVEGPRVAGGVGGLQAPSGWLRFVGFAVLTFAAGAVGRATFDESLRISLVWPLYGLAILWLASGNRRTWPLDVVGLSLAVAASVLVDGGSWQQTVVATVLAAPAAGVWLVIMRRLAPDLWGAGGRRPLGTLSDLVAFLVATTVTAVLAALVRSSGLGLVPPASGPEEVLLTAVRNLSWMMGLGALGLLVLSQRSLDGTDRRTLRELVHLPLPRIAETLLVALLTAGVAMLVFAESPTPLAFALVLATVWAAFRLPTVAALLVALVIGTTAVLATLQGSGVFDATGTRFESAAIAQGFLITQVLAALAISFATEERRAALARAGVAEQDATERALLLGAVIDHVDEGILVVMPGGRYGISNRDGRRLSLGPGGGTTRTLVSASGAPLAADETPFARALAGEDVMGEVYRLRTPHEPEQVLRVSAVRVDTARGEPMAVCTFRDVTREQDERDQLVSFAGVVAHDLKNPLTVVRGWTESLREELEGDESPDVGALRSMLKRVEGASDQMRQFIDDLLTFTVARNRPLDITDVDLTAVAEEVAELRRVDGSLPRISVQPGMRVHADRALVRQLLDNLVGNAVKYVAPGTRPQVDVTATSHDGELVVSVTDNGIGIPSAMEERVFESFARAHAADYTGTGLGLAICERAVTRHGGRIWVDESPAPGTRISFTLPGV